MKVVHELRAAIGGEPPPDAGLPPAAWTFLRGLSVGALVGAVVAGSALLGRRRERSSQGQTGGGSRADGAGSGSSARS